ncbi:MAG: hypothetical protein R2751_09870 [Bacteroidales bacterium]
MNPRFPILLSLLLLVSCGTTAPLGNGRMNYGSPNVKQHLKNENTFVVSHYATDPTYGYTEKNPVMVGGQSEGPKNERRFLNALCGPNGEQLVYDRIGSCCNFDTRNSSFSGGLLDMYNVSYPGLEENLVLFINMYDSDTLRVPVGLRLRD